MNTVINNRQRLLQDPGHIPEFHNWTLTHRQVGLGTQLRPVNLQFEQIVFRPAKDSCLVERIGDEKGHGSPAPLGNFWRLAALLQQQ